MAVRKGRTTKQLSVLNKLIRLGSLHKFSLNNISVKILLVTITPKLADEILEHCNFRNRTVRQNSVRKLAKYMLEGMWRTEHPLLITDNGEFLGGQHRLLAVRESGVSCVFMLQIVSSITAHKTNEVDDDVNPRTLSDYLHFNGVEDSSRVAPLLKLERNARISGGNPCQSAAGEKQDYLKLYKSIGAEPLKHAVQAMPTGFHKVMGLNRAFIDWLALQLGTGEAELFFSLIQDPSSLRKEDAPMVLNQRFLEMAARKTGVVPMIELGTILVKGWNRYYCNERTTKRHLVYRPREDFPGIMGTTHQTGKA